MPTSLRTVLLSRLAASVLALGATSLAAHGQQGLGEAVTEAARLSDDNQRQIQQFVDQHKADLAKAAEPAAVRAARVRLIEPLVKPTVSVEFRLAYSTALVPVLEPLVADKSDFVASNAVQVLGELATPRAVDQVTRALSDKRAAVRFSAAYAAQRTFENLMPPRGAGLTPAQVIAVVDEVSNRLSKEDDANVTQALILALEAASSVPSSQLAGVRSHAVANASARVAAIAKAVDAKGPVSPGLQAVLWRTNRLCRTALTEAPANEPRLSAEALKQTGGLAGHSLALVRRRLAAPQPPSADERDMLVKVVALAEASYYFAHSAIARGDVVDAKLAQALTAGDDAGFRSKVLDIIGPHGALTSPAFGFPPTEFVNEKP
jgi:predicted metallopeptidase